MNTRRVNVVADAICRAQKNGTVTPAGIAMALEGMGLLQSPETAAELESLRARVAAPVSLSGPVCSQAEARAAGLDVAPSVEELTAMAESVVASGDPLSAGVDLARAVPLLGAEVERLRARVAELEALTPAAVQTCRVCGAGYTYGEPCSRCVFEAHMAAASAAGVEDPHDSPLHHAYRQGRDLPETGGAR